MAGWFLSEEASEKIKRCKRQRADEYLWGSSCFLEKTDWRRWQWQFFISWVSIYAWRLCGWYGLYSYWIDGNCRVSVWWLMGLSGWLLLCADEPLWWAKRFYVFCGWNAQAGDSGNFRLGTGAFSKRCSLPWTFWRTAVVWTSGQQTWWTPGLGNIYFWLRKNGSEKLPRCQCTVLDREVPYWRTSCGCRCLYAVFGLWKKRWRVASEQRWRKWALRGNSFPAAFKFRGGKGASGSLYHCGRVDGMAGRYGAGSRWRTWLFLQMEYGLDEWLFGVHEIRSIFQKRPSEAVVF